MLTNLSTLHAVWTSERIEREWLDGGTLGTSADAVVAAFQRVSRLLGDEWTEQYRNRNGWGPHPTVDVAVIGEHLRHVEGSVNSEALLARLRSDETSARAELTAIAIACGERDGLRVRLEPDLSFAGSARVPDFALVPPGSNDEVFVEVTAPEDSREYRAIVGTAKRIAESVLRFESSFGLELFMAPLPQ